MKRVLSALLLVLLLAAVLPVQLPVRAESSTQVSVRSQYVLDRYGFAIINETVTILNNGTTAAPAPDVGIGLGNLTLNVVSVNFTGAGQFSNSTVGGLYVVTGGESLQAGNKTTFSLKALLNGVVSHATNGSLLIAVLNSPYVSVGVSDLLSTVRMPGSTQFVDSPPGFKQTYAGTNVTYSRSQANLTTQSAVVRLAAIAQYSGQDFHPLDVYSASRTISIGPDGNPEVKDTIAFKNLGTTSLQSLVVAPLTSPSGTVTVQPPTEPPLLNPTAVALSNNAIALSSSAIGYAVQAGANYTIVYQYSLDPSYYTVAGGTVNLKIPLAPPIAAFVGSYTIGLSLPPGATAVQTGTSGEKLSNVRPQQPGSVALAYGLSIGWALDSGVPAASVLFVVLLVGLFVSRSTTTEEEESEEESSTERASAMIKAFEDKTGLINHLFTEIPNVRPEERDKAYFDELRGRLDAYRSRALQRLNEVKQKSTTQRFFELLNQLHATEREVDRAAKDTLNLYEQYYTNRMRKEVFDRLLPQYRKRLEKALDQLSEELHVVQREAKLL